MVPRFRHCAFLSLSALVARVALSAPPAVNATPLDDMALASFEESVLQVEAQIKSESRFPREDLLVMSGRSAAATGKFDRSAAAYLLFLRDFGFEHPYSPQAVTRCIDSLFPLQMDSTEVTVIDGHPQFTPHWRMQCEESQERVRQAVALCERALSHFDDHQLRAGIKYREGWMHRVLNDWDASTASWDRAAAEKSATYSPDAQWLAAENCEWLSRPQEAASRLSAFAHAFPEDARCASIPRRIARLTAESKRSQNWQSNPLQALQLEIEARKESKTPGAIFQEVVSWLSRTNRQDDLLQIGRWAVQQTDWDQSDRRFAQTVTIDALLSKGAGPNANRAEINHLFDSLLALCDDSTSTINVALRYVRFLQSVKDSQKALVVLEALRARISDDTLWDDRLAPEKIRALVALGKSQSAREELAALTKAQPGNDQLASLESLVASGSKEDKR